MESLLLIVTVSALNIVCFFVGVKAGQKISKGEEIKIPEVNLMQLVKERNEKKVRKLEQDRFDTIMRNIEKYDGSGNGQEDVPRG